MENLYETIFIARQDLTSSQVEALTKKFTKVIQDSDGQVGKTEYCGLRTLAYMMRKNRKGHYVLMNVTAPGEAIAEVERVMRINEDILRYLTVRVDEHEKGPSALLKSSRQSRDYSDDGAKGGHYGKKKFERKREHPFNESGPQDKSSQAGAAPESKSKEETSQAEGDAS